MTIQTLEEVVEAVVAEQLEVYRKQYSCPLSLSDVWHLATQDKNFAENIARHSRLENCRGVHVRTCLKQIFKSKFCSPQILELSQLPAKTSAVKVVLVVVMTKFGCSQTCLFPDLCIYLVPKLVKHAQMHCPGNLIQSEGRLCINLASILAFRDVFVEEDNFAADMLKSMEVDTLQYLLLGTLELYRDSEDQNLSATTHPPDVTPRKA